MGIHTAFNKLFGVENVEISGENLRLEWEGKDICLGVDLSGWIHNVLSFNALPVIIRAAYYRIVDIIKARQ